MKNRLLSLALILCMAISLLPMTTMAAGGTPADGWYQLRAMNNYLNLNSSGNAELRKKADDKNEAFYVENKGKGQITMKMGDGSYLGISGAIADGTKVKAVNAPYLWNVYSESGNDIFSLRTPENTQMVLNASGEKNDDGTAIILWTHKGTDAPNNAEIRFIPTKAAKAVTLKAKPSTTVFVMNDKDVSVPEAYDVNDSNYLQLRGIAVLLNGTAAQFNVGWDGTYAVIEAGKPYDGKSNPAILKETTNVRKSDTPFKLDNDIISFNKAYLIGGDSNYIQLREVAEKLSGTASQFNVYWDNTAGKAVIVVGEAYTGVAPGTETPTAPADKKGASASADKVDMTLVPAGSFKVDKRTVTISKPFYMGTFEVTQEQFKSVMGKNPSLIQGTGKVAIPDEMGGMVVFNRTPPKNENPAKRPVDRVNWHSAIVFCNKLSMKEGLTPAYRLGGHTDPKYWGRIPTTMSGTSDMWNGMELVQGSTGYRLPTAAQWEYACRAGGSEDIITDDLGWYVDNSNAQTHEVGMKKPNAIGLYDMYGNIFEWIWDWWYSSLPTYSQVDPMGPGAQSDNNMDLRVGRGGCFFDAAEQCSADERDIGMFAEIDTKPFMGFRVMRPDQSSFEHTDKPVVEGMTWIPGGTFMMGSPETEEGRQKGETQKEQTVKGFYMDTYEFTQQHGYDMTGETYGSYKRNAYYLTEGESWMYHPVETLSWYDAIKLCNIRSVQEGLDPAYSIKNTTNTSKWGLVPTQPDAKWDAVKIMPNANGYRLPTAAQWEYACRAGTTTAYNNGKDTMIGGSINSDNTAWFADNSSYQGSGALKTHEVGFLPANAFGLYDMHGNVAEWCWDASSGGKRIYRGGGYGDSASYIRSASSFHTLPSEEKNYIGMRMVRPDSANMPEKSAFIPDSGLPLRTPLITGWYQIKIRSSTFMYKEDNSTPRSSKVFVNDGSQFQKVYIENLGNNIITIRANDGKYWGIEGEIKNKATVSLVSKPFNWYITFETGGIRPASDTGRVVIVNGRPNDSGYPAGTGLCLTTRAIPNINIEEAGNSELRFYPTKAPGYYKWKSK